MKNKNTELTNLILTNPPSFHYWEEQERTGGFNQEHFHFLEKVIKDVYVGDIGHRPLVVETGAGLSSLWFLAAGYEVHSFSLDNVIEKMRVFLSAYPDELARWSGISGNSETNLPQFIKSKSFKHCAIGLIDGSHSLPSVFVDFTFINLCLEEGGILFIDDIQLPGPRYLANMLNHLKADFSFSGAINKLCSFKKISGRSFWGDNFNGVDFSVDPNSNWPPP